MLAIAVAVYVAHRPTVKLRTHLTVHELLLKVIQMMEQMATTLCLSHQYLLLAVMAAVMAVITMITHPQRLMMTLNLQ
jgi:hypothetical protein